eukprot:CAMPEP_0170176888 /NCGR_PEP_ID=MMETSP0040_2-20121228/9651_1 /TAXON_ID=641309 /ORGANISM="Lotharella oceanica, Strain CCMP622" /LENGTH=146 /DNA_ID=CAMNT_0010419341 /DNA_START=69 /DNA_END=509 /DNA_ORIENTATION=+
MIPAPNRRYFRARRRTGVSNIGGKSRKLITQEDPNFPWSVSLPPNRRDLSNEMLNRCGDYHYDLRSFRKAIVYYKTAAMNGDTIGMQNLAYCFKLGHGVMTNAKISQEWHRKATEPHLRKALTNVSNGDLKLMDQKSIFIIILCYV